MQQQQAAHGFRGCLDEPLRFGRVERLVAEQRVGHGLADGLRLPQHLGVAEIVQGDPERLR